MSRVSVPRGSGGVSLHISRKRPEHQARDREADRGEGERREAGEDALGDAEVDAPDQGDHQHAEVGGGAAAAGGSALGHGPKSTPARNGPVRPAAPRAPAPLFSPHVSVPHPQLLHRRPHRSWQIHPRRPAHRGDRRRGEAPDAGAAARHDGPRARARHHHQAERRPDELHGAERRRATSSTSSTRRATWTSPTRCRARSPPARARSWWWTPRRASRRRR